MFRKIFAGHVCLAFAAPMGAQAEPDLSALQSQIVQLNESVRLLTLKVDEQAREIASLKTPQPPQTSDPAAAPSKMAQAQGRWNPDIGVIGDIVFQNDSPREDAEGADRVSVRELELVFGSAVDPYSRFDATLAVADFEDLHVEEAYLTRYGLPFDMTARIGRILPKIGKTLAVHRDTLDTADLPLVVEKYFGHHGFHKTGVDVARALELPTPFTHDVTFGVLEGGNGEEGSLFGDTRRHPTLYTHLKNYVDLADTAGLELGVSHVAGSRDDDSTFEVSVLGLDATWIWRYADQRHVKLQGEAFGVSRTESFYVLEDPATGEFSEQDLDDARHLWGGYALADWRFHPQWAAGFRFDDVQLIETAENFANPLQVERGYTGYLTFYQSEFARWRVQFSHLDRQDDNDDDRLFVQGTFAIGEHKHKLT